MAINELIRQAAYVYTPQATCPIALGETGTWVNLAGGHLWRNADGTDSSSELLPASVTNGGAGNFGKVLALDAAGKAAGRVLETDGSTLDGLAALIAAATIQIYMSTAGNDANPGTLASPVRTLGGAQQRLKVRTPLPGAFGQIRGMLPGDYAEGSQLEVHLPANTGLGTPFTVVGDAATIVDRLGAQVAAAGSTVGLLNTASLSALLVNEATCSIVAGAPAGQVRVLTTKTFVVGRRAELTGAGTAGNNTIGKVTAVNPGISFDMVNAQGVAGDANNGAITAIESLEGCYITFGAATTTAALRNKMYRVYGNGLTSIEPNTVMAAAPVNTDTFTVSMPGFNITGPVRFHSVGDSTLGWVNVKFTPGTNNVVEVNGAVDVIQQGCEVDGGMTQRNSGHVECGASGANWSPDGANNPFSTGNNSANGLFFHDGTLLCTNQGFLANAIHFSHATVTVQRSLLVLQQSSGRRTTLNFAAGSILTMASSNNVTYPSKWDGQLTAAASTGIFNLTDASWGTFPGTNGFMTVKNSAGWGIVFDQGTRSNPPTGLTFTGNTTGDILATNRADVVLPAGITGTLGIKTDLRPLRTLTDFYTNAPIGVEQDTAGGQSRIATAASTAQMMVPPKVLDIAATTAVAVMPGIPVSFRYALGDAAGDFDLPVHEKFEALAVRGFKTNGAGGAGDLVQVKAGATAISDAISLAVADKAVLSAASIDDAANVIAAGGTLRVTITDGNAGATDLSCRIEVIGVLRA